MFTLPDLPYAPEALEPYIDKATMEIHHDKHHAAYVDNLNKALPGKSDSDLPDILKNLDDLPEPLRTQVQNHGGGHANHSFFWKIMSPNPSNPSSSLLSLLGPLDTFKEKFTAAALGRFGSGWAWLVQKDGKLEVVDTPNQDIPEGKILLGLDVWEHAYYLKYQNRRAEYIENWWHIVNWNAVSGNLARGQV